MLMNVQCSGDLRSFAKETRALKMRSEVAGHWKLTTTNREPSSELILLQLVRSCWTTQCQSFHGHSAFEANWKGEKAHWAGASWADQKFFKNCLGVLSSLILQSSEPFLYQIVMCNEKWSAYDNQQWSAQWLDQEEVPKHFPKPNLRQKRGPGHCLVVCCPSDPL